MLGFQTKVILRGHTAETRGRMKPEIVSEIESGNVVLANNGDVSVLLRGRIVHRLAHIKNQMKTSTFMHSFLHSGPTTEEERRRREEEETEVYSRSPGYASDSGGSSVVWSDMGDMGDIVDIVDPVQKESAR